MNFKIVFTLQTKQIIESVKMREIKFRAWNKLSKRIMYRGVFDRNWYTESKAGKCIDGIHPNDAYNVELMQYTGLKDKNGAEIYEGDILKSTCYIGGNYLDTLTDKVFVSFHNYKWAIQPVKRNLLRPQPITELEDDCEVIGNIYENPELLGK